MKFDLETWGTGEIVLVHWDSMHGDDVIIVLQDGEAYLDTADHKIDNLVDYLVELLKSRGEK